MNNYYLETQIANMKLNCSTFFQSCKLAAVKNDGTIDKEEQKVLKKIENATNEYIKQLSKL